MGPPVNTDCNSQSSAVVTTRGLAVTDAVYHISLILRTSLTANSVPYYARRFASVSFVEK